MLAGAANAGAELAPLPELALGGYLLGRGLWKRAEPIGGPLTSWACERARRYGLHLGITLIEAAGGHFRDGFVPATPDGEVAGVVRESRLAWIKARWHRGHPGPRAIDAALGRIGAGLCHEDYLASSLRELAASRVDPVLHPTAAATPPAAWPIGARGAAAFDSMLGTLAVKHARALGAPVVIADMCGDHAVAGLATRFPGLSSIVDGAGEVRAALGGEEGVIVADVSLGEARTSGSSIGYTRYWSAPMSWYAPAWRVAQHLCTIGYRLDGERRAIARTAGSSEGQGRAGPPRSSPRA